MVAVGISREPVHRHLRCLRADGLVDWEDYAMGTLHALVQPIVL